MSTALYRRYRPDTFADVIGQEHVTDPLMAALQKNRVNHAYLFSGPRGCGKTTSARILARCLNCAEGPTPTPCGTCDSCVELGRGGPGSLDVIEIDAASHGGVDDARDLRERATFAPVRDRYKIFIIDEAHMVTSAGFNALLKIVEEPPEHIKFIFATTEPDKVIGTIRSRTHHYPFRLVPPEPLMQYLELLCRQENVPVAPGVLSLVIRAGGGSVRDSLSVLDQLMAGAGPSGLDYELAVSLLGYTHASLLDDVVDAFAAADASTVFNAVDRVVQTGHDPRRFVEDLLERFRDLIIVRAMPESAHAILRGVPEDQIARMQTQANQLGAAELSRAADITNQALTEMTGATSPRLHLELLCARILLPSADQGEQGVAARVDRIERRLSYGGAPVSAPIDNGQAPVAHAAAEPQLSGPAAARAALRGANANKEQTQTSAESPRQDAERITPPRVSTADWPREDQQAATAAANARPAAQPAQQHDGGAPATSAGTAPVASGTSGTAISDAAGVSSAAASAAPAAEAPAAATPAGSGAPAGPAVAGPTAPAEPGPTVPSSVFGNPRDAGQQDAGVRGAANAGRAQESAASTATETSADWGGSWGAMPEPAPAPEKPATPARAQAPVNAAAAPAAQQSGAPRTAEAPGQRQPQAQGHSPAQQPAPQRPAQEAPAAQQQPSRPEPAAAPSAAQQQPSRPEPAAAQPSRQDQVAPQTSAPRQDQSAPQASGQIEMIRRAWPEILSTLSGIRKVTWMNVSANASPLSLDGTALTLGFKNQGSATNFGNGDHAENLRQAIQQVLGMDLRILTVEDASVTAGESGPKVPTSRQQPADGGWSANTATVNAPAPVPEPMAHSTPPNPAPASAPPVPPAGLAPTPDSAPSRSSAASSMSAVSAPSVVSATSGFSAPSGVSSPSAGSGMTAPSPMSASSTGSAPSAASAASAASGHSAPGGMSGPPAATAATGMSAASGFSAASGASAPSGMSGTTAASAPSADSPSSASGNGQRPAALPGEKPVFAQLAERMSSASSAAAAGAPGAIAVKPAADHAATGTEAPSPNGAGQPNVQSPGAQIPGRSDPTPSAPASPYDDVPYANDEPPAEEWETTPDRQVPGQKRSRYQQLLDQAKATQATATPATPSPSGRDLNLKYVEDIPSDDDESIEDSGLVGRAAIERLLGGRLIEERSHDGS
ncbi:DNA polymerase III subunit gamma and tau [Arthrobacter sulfonylureivorans]|uniref:DNA-directed DNA polymerase n=1 Tax=Arthrobacter sulfonylureivorans TaxID=2486855 RepID=A0ABY3W958_9MICC|nr:DNA polymerase III subunit gamma and tau [Arthrobacter sulfonylureivorans]UNK45755.1 DNA polymerase III subunit gamma and tau [Arthrobacter sulfonylureivorans]